MKTEKNKYQEALDFLFDEAATECEIDNGELISYDCTNKDKYLIPAQTLQELIDKANPKQPKGLSVSHEGRLGNCPCCNKLVYEKSSKPNICECGQKLDWN